MQNKNDLMSRQKTINAWKEDFKKCVNSLDDIPWDDYKVIMQYIDTLPSAQPEKMRGKWIDDGLYGDNFPHHAWLCSECGEGVIEIDTPWYNYCPNCGADMRGEQDEQTD